MVSTSTLLEWRFMTKNLSTNSENPGQLAEATPENLLTYDEFVDLYEDDLYIEFMETGAYYEFEEEDWLEKRYEEYENS
jgi:hypothetical protein